VFNNINYNPKSGITGKFDSLVFSDQRFSPPAENLFEDLKGIYKTIFTIQTTVRFKVTKSLTD
jgi:hypothetical protein